MLGVANHRKSRAEDDGAEPDENDQRQHRPREAVINGVAIGPEQCAGRYGDGERPLRAPEGGTELAQQRG